MAESNKKDKTNKVGILMCSTGRTSGRSAGRVARLESLSDLPRTLWEVYFNILQSDLHMLKKSKTNSLLKRFFTNEMIEKLGTKKTTHRGTLEDCISIGIDNLDSEIGVSAFDAECYRLFADLFVPIIEEYHRIGKTTVQPKTNWGNIVDFEDLDPSREYVVKTGVECFRNLKGYQFAGPKMSQENYDKIEASLENDLRKMEGEVQGTYHPLSAMYQDDRQEFVAKYYSRNGIYYGTFYSRYYICVDGPAILNWPTGRGLYCNKLRTFKLYIGEGDHMTMVSEQRGGKVGPVFNRLIYVLDHLQQTNEFATHERFGYLTYCPSNVGQAIRPYFHVKVPKLAANMPKFQALAAKYDMKIIEIFKKTKEQSIYELQNTRRLGRTEYESVKKMCLGVTEIIETEKQLPAVDSK